MATGIESVVEQDQKQIMARTAKDLLGSLIQYGQYVGEVWSSSFGTALIMIHDHHRKKVGGIAGLSFLVATRIKEDEEIDYTKEDSSAILLRVMDAAPLPDSAEADRIRVGAAKQATDETGHWDEAGFMDGRTANELAHAGVECRVIGTFYLDKGPAENLVLKFGSDLSNYYPNRGLKVYKPTGAALEKIVNYRDPVRITEEKDPLFGRDVHVGEVRYASTNRPFQGVANVPVRIAPADLIAQKTALFGMTRIGKSNTTKIIAKAVYALRLDPPEKDPREGRIGQLIFDYNGEYANDNVQDGPNLNPTSLKNVWKMVEGMTEDKKSEEVVTYGLTPHPNDKKRNLMKINFYRDDDLATGKEIINSLFDDSPAGETRYADNFKGVRIEKRDLTGDRGVDVRNMRTLLAYRAVLALAGYPVPAKWPLNRPTLKLGKTSLFGKDILDAMRGSTDKQKEKFAWAASVLSGIAAGSEVPGGSEEEPDGSVSEEFAPEQEGTARAAAGTVEVTWEMVAQALEILNDFISRGKDTGYNTFKMGYMKGGKSWDDTDFMGIVGILPYKNGLQVVGKGKDRHSEDVEMDFTDAIYNDLVKGKLVIVDQSSGDQDMAQMEATRVMQKIFARNMAKFVSGQAPPRILVYIEEAHNLLPAGDKPERGETWTKTAKEGGKLMIGLVYATQEVSSIHKNILKATANWFIGHLNCTDETKELRKFYDFGDFEDSILRAQDKGFLRVKTLSNLFVVPTQIRLFSIEG